MKRADELLVWTPEKPRKPEPSPPPPQESLSPSLRLFPWYVHDAAQRLQDGGLQGEVVEREYAADELPILRFLETLYQSGERAALARLAILLRFFPLMLGHPYIWGIIGNLYSGSWMSDEANQASFEWLIELANAWAEGMTLGYRVTITEPGRGRRGRTPDLFPHLDDRDGWLRTEEASKEYSDALHFWRVYEDLTARLEARVRWKTERQQYRKRLNAQQPTAYLVREQAEKIAQVFDQFKRNWKITGNPLPEEVLRKIIQAGLEVRKGGNPRHTVACRLLATLTWWTIQGQPMKLTPSLVESTLETLRKYGIGQKEPTQEPPATPPQTFWTTELPPA
jgi:hypothetical protein